MSARQSSEGLPGGPSFNDDCLGNRPSEAIQVNCSTSTANVSARKKPAPLKLETTPHHFLDPKPPPEDREIGTTIDLSFSELSYTVQPWCFKKPKDILQNISGEFRSGELTAIMGSSGAGKSTLMDILTGYTSKWTGSVKINGYERDIKRFRKQSCYIMQNDHLQPLLTVQEAMNVAANLKLGPSVTSKEKRSRINQILSAIGLNNETKNVRTINLSGGQKKRLAIALELISNPPIMFFDEPTSGLDSHTSKQCIGLLQKLAYEGRTIICTIHQPPATLLEMFDHLYVISKGRCVYQGSIKGLVPYLGQLNLKCPPYHNPADYVLDVSSGEYGDHDDQLVMKCGNGKNNDWRKTCRDTAQINASLHLNRMVANGLITPINAPNIPLTPFLPIWIANDHMSESSPKLKYSIDPRACCKNEKRYPISFFAQIMVLLLRNMRILSRDKVLCNMRFLIHMSIAIVVGILYFQIGKEAQYIRDNFNFIFFSIIFLMFTATNSMALSFPFEMPIIKTEHFNRWYSLKAYYIAMTITDAPIQFISTLVFAIITYFLTGQPMEFFRFSYYTIMCLLVSFAAQSIGILNGALFSIQNGAMIGPFFMLPFIMFSGFFIHLNDAHPSLQWLFHISYIKYGFEGAMLSVFGYNREKLACTSEYCHYKYPSKFLVEVDMDQACYFYSVIAIFGLYVIIKIFTYFAINYRIRARQ